MKFSILTSKHLVSSKIFEGSVLESLASFGTEIRKLELELALRTLDVQKERELREKEKEREAQNEMQRLDHE